MGYLAAPGIWGVALSEERGLNSHKSLEYGVTNCWLGQDRGDKSDIQLQKFSSSYSSEDHQPTSYRSDRASGQNSQPWPCASLHQSPESSLVLSQDKAQVYEDSCRLREVWAIPGQRPVARFKNRGWGKGRSSCRTLIRLCQYCEASPVQVLQHWTLNK